MKKKLLALLTVVCSMQLALAADLPLSLSDLVPTGDNTVDPSTGVITFASNWNPLTWTFDPAIKKDEYTGLKITFKTPVEANMIELKIKYVSGVEDVMVINKGTTILQASFTADVQSIAFQSSNWQDFPSGPPYPTVTVDEVILIGYFETEEEALPLDELRVDWGDNTADAATGVITLSTNYSGIYWVFDPPKANDTYVGMEVYFATPIAHNHLQLWVRYVGDENPTGVGLATGSSALAISFTADVEAIGFQCNNWENFPAAAPFPSVTIEKVFLLKKADTTSIPVVTDTDDNGPVDVYTITGVKVRSRVNREDAMNTLPNGIYIIGNKKAVINR